MRLIRSVTGVAVLATALGCAGKMPREAAERRDFEAVAKMESQGISKDALDKFRASAKLIGNRQNASLH